MPFNHCEIEMRLCRISSAYCLGSHHGNGFDALTIGQAQMFTIGDTKTLGGTTVNEFHAGFLRNANNIGQPNGGLGVTLQSQGFVTGVGTPGIVVQAPKYEGVENIVFPSFVMGVPITNVNQWNNTLYLSDTVSKVFGAHTLKIGGQFYLRAITTVAEHQPLGKSNFNVPLLVDVYLDARPTDRLRAFVLGRLAYDPLLSSTALVAGVPRGLDQPALRTRFGLAAGSAAATGAALVGGFLI